MSINDQRRWFVTSPGYQTLDGETKHDVIVVEAVSIRQAIVVGVKAMRGNAKYAWPTVADQAGINADSNVTATPVDEDEEATRRATRRPSLHSPFKRPTPAAR